MIIPKSYIKSLKISIPITIILCLIIYLLAQLNEQRVRIEHLEDRIKIKKEEMDKLKSEIKYLSQLDPIDKVLLKYFSKEEAVIAKAILTHESQLNTKAINYNCRYNGKSTFCKKGDEHKAWSVDCGIAQLNYHGKVCPAYTFDLELSIKKMAEMYKKRGWQPWVSYNSGAYKQYLTLKI